MDTRCLCMGCMKEKGTALICPHCGWQENNIEDYSQQYLPIRSVLNNKFLIGRVLGFGGFGITYLGWDLDLDVKVAIKEYMPQGLAGRTQDKTTVSIYTGNKKQQFDYGMDKFLDEAKTIAQFSDHPNIVSVKHFFKENGTAYFVMSYVEGITLKQYINSKPNSRIDFSTTCSITSGVIKALAVIHGKGLLHRDISPDNIYINNDGIVKVLDFGAARYALSEQSSNLSIILKPGYAPEEQYRSKGKQGPWTDIYALAATIYNSLTGQVPQEALDRLDEDMLIAPSKLDIEIPQIAEETLMKALSVKAVNRFQNIEEFKQAFLGNNYKASSIDDIEIINRNLHENSSAQSEETNDTDYKTSLLPYNLWKESSENLMNTKKDVIEDEFASRKNKQSSQNEQEDNYIPKTQVKIQNQGHTDLVDEPNFKTDKTKSEKNKLNNKITLKHKAALCGVLSVFLIVSLILLSKYVTNKQTSISTVVAGNMQSINNAVGNKLASSQNTKTPVGVQGAGSNAVTSTGTAGGTEPSQQQVSQSPAIQQQQSQTQSSGQQVAQNQSIQQSQTQQTTQAQVQQTTTANYDLVNQYITASQYDKAVVQASQIITSGDNSSQILGLMNTAAKKLDDIAYNLYHSGSKDQSAKYYALLASTKWVPQNFANDGKNNAYNICYELGNYYLSKNNYYNTVYYANWALWAGNTKAQNPMVSAANALYSKVLTDISNNSISGTKGSLDLLAHITKYEPQSYVPQDIQNNSIQIYNKYFN